MSVRCQSCGTRSRANAKFCDECGATLDSVGDPAEYKFVTVLFADVVRSMELAATLELERYREVMGALVSRVAAVVARYGGGQVDYTGDGVMAVFGAPVAMEDHAFRACLAALEIQREVGRFAEEVQQTDGVTVRVRVGLNSGQVIAGDIGTAPLAYTATGETVGFAQRMESVAPAGGVMLSEATARQVEALVVLSEPQLVRIKGADASVEARQLLSIRPRSHTSGRMEASLVGRGWECSVLDAMLDRAIAGRGGVVQIGGPPGIGKSRAAREAAVMAQARGVEVFWSFCESHTVKVPLHAVAHLLRATSGVADSEGQVARMRLRESVPRCVDEHDLLLLEDLLGIAEAGVARPPIDPEARRRRLTGLVNSIALARTRPALCIVEDVHWIDSVSEEMLAEFLAVVSRTPALVLITARPEYAGRLAEISEAQRISLAPLDDSEVAALLTELLGSHPSVAEPAAAIAARAAGNPFFVEEMVRELVQRGVLSGQPGAFVCATNIEEVTVPSTVHAIIEARLDRLSSPAKRTLSAASVIGIRFRADLLAALDVEPVFDELCGVGMIDQVRFTPVAEYAFCHPLIRTVAYESQLKSDRADWHRRVAAALEEAAGESVDEEASLIAEHLQAAGESRSAYGWHMRAAAWSAGRDLGAARISWERARRIADQVPDEDPDALALRIAPRTMLCATEWQGLRAGQGRFEELRALCAQAGDKFSLAIGMTGPMTELMYTGRSSEGAHLASEQMALLESIGDSAATVGLVIVPICTWFDLGQFREVWRLSQTAVELAEGDPAMGSGFGFGSPLAAALVWRGTAGLWLGRPGWQDDLDAAVDMARRSDPTSFAAIVTWSCAAIHYGLMPTDDATLELIEEGVRTAEGSSNVGVTLITYTHGVALLNCRDVERRARGLQVMARAREMFVREDATFLATVADLWTAWENFRSGDAERSLEAMRAGVDELGRAGRVYYGLWGASALVESLLTRGRTADLAEARRVTEVWANHVDESEAIPRLTLLRMRTLLAWAGGDRPGARNLLAQYCAAAEALGLDNDPEWAAALV